MKPQLTLLALAVAATLAHAQVAPDAGQTLQQQRQQPVEPPRPSTSVVIPSATTTAPAPGGQAVALKAVVFHGQSRLSDAALQAVVRDAIGQSLDLNGLWRVAQRVSDAYRAAGYPFARAYLPPQELKDGTLRIEIVEGRYGRVTAQGDASLAPAAQAWLRHLVPGDVIEGAPLERATMLLGELPGVVVAPVMRPGSAPGTGDLDVDVQRSQRLRGSIGLDDQGNRYTGPYRLQLDARTGSALTLGDQAVLHAMRTDGKLWFGSLGYSLPLGADGLRGHVEVSHTYYVLGRDFVSLDATGTANAATAGVAWPLLRSQNANLTLDASATHKAMRDAQGTAGTHQAKSSNAVPLALNFDRHDDLFGGGLTYGALSLTAGRLDLGTTLAVTDRSTARTEGSWVHVNVDVARTQAVGPSMSLFGRVAAQWANKNLDSSEGFGPGGVGGVRAFPGGEAYGDAGWLMQLEARRNGSGPQPYAFYDMGGSKTNMHPWAPGDNHRFLSGLGLGVRGQVDRFSFDASVAHATRGGPANSDTHAGATQYWVSGSMAF